jgi:hypothetical protein
MFDQLFFRSDALTRQLSAPLPLGPNRRRNVLECAAKSVGVR